MVWSENHAEGHILRVIGNESGGKGGPLSFQVQLWSTDVKDISFHERSARKPPETSAQVGGSASQHPRRLDAAAHGQIRPQAAADSL